MVAQKPFLTGIQAVAEAMGFSIPTIIKHKREYPGMPINLVGGTWIGDQAALMQFYKDLGAGNTERYLESSPSPAGKPGNGKSNAKTQGAKPTDPQAGGGEGAPGSQPEDGEGNGGEGQNPSS